jgi:hypothetical protein
VSLTLQINRSSVGAPVGLSQRLMPNKIYSVTITLPDLVAAHAEQEVRVESSNWPSAVRAACDEISKRPHVRGKHIKSAKIYLSMLDRPDKSGIIVKADSTARERGDDSQGVLFDI